MNGPGNVFSRPMRMPTTLSLICRFSYVPIHHVLPVRPIVCPAVPYIELGGHPLLLQDARETLRFVDVRVVTTRRDDDLGLPERSQKTIAVQIREEGERVHEVRFPAPFAVQPPRRVVRARHADCLARNTRAPSDERERVECAERATGDDQLIHGVRIANRRKDFFDEVPLVREMPACAVLWGGRFVVEGLAIDRIDAPELQPARIDARCHVRDQAEILPLIEAAHRSRKDEDRGAAVAKDEQLHIATEGRTPPLAILALHGDFRARARASPMSFQATSASCHPFTSADLLLSSSLWVAKKVSISRSQCFPRSPRALTSSNRGSPTGTPSIFSSSPCSSRMSSVPIGRDGTTQPGKVGSSTTISASSGSPSPPMVSMTKP